MNGIEGATFRANLATSSCYSTDWRRMNGSCWARPRSIPISTACSAHAQARTLEARSVSSETALLFLTLATPDTLPSYVVARLGADVQRTIGRLVLDGVLEIERDGEYVHGVRAAGLVAVGRSEGGRGRIGELSVAALRYSQQLIGVPESLLALRLYFYGRRPVSAALRKRLGDDASPPTWGSAGSAAPALATGWRELPPAAPESTHWRHWRVGRARRGRAAMRPGSRQPRDDGTLGQALATVASSLSAARGVVAFQGRRRRPRDLPARQARRHR